MTLIRTQDEIVMRAEERKLIDPFGFEWQEYACYLDLEHVKPYLKDPANETWTPTTDDPLEMAKDYMEFAKSKALDQRGISANRSIMHYIAWLWLAGEDVLLKRVEDEYKNNYYAYGMPILEIICDHFGWTP